MDKTKTLKNLIKTMLPKAFTANVSKNGLNVVLHVDLGKVSGIHNAESIVKQMVKGLKKQGIKLDFIESGTDLHTNIRDWEFINLNAENEMLYDANEALEAMKKFFKKYGNAYCESPKTYSIIEKMRALVETDEN